MTEPLTQSESDEYQALCEAYFSRDADVDEVYRHGNLTKEQACEVYADRARARRLGLPVPKVVAQPVPLAYGRKPGLQSLNHWASFVRDQRQGHGTAGRDLWERQSQYLSLIEHEPITAQEQEARDHTGATGEHERLDAWQEWLEEQRQGQRPQVARATVSYALTDDLEPYTGPEPRSQGQPYLTR